MTRLRRVLLFAGGGLLLLAGLALFLWRHEIGFYWRLLQVYRSGQSFYASHPRLERDIVFHPDFDVRLDVASPATGDGYPVLVFIHGGGWDSYQKELFAPAAEKLTAKGIVTVIPDYTLYPEAGYAQMTREMAAAVAWTLENIERYGGDPARVVVAGHSAGGHLAGLVALDERWLQAFGHSPADLCGWIGLSGVYDVNGQMAFERSTGGTAPVMTAVMGGEENFAAASPVTYASAAAPPTLLIHGGQDTTVPLSLSEELHAALSAAGAASELIVYPQKGHTDFLFDVLSDENAPALQDISRFAEQCLRIAK